MDEMFAFSDMTIFKVIATLLEVEIFLSVANSFIVELTFLAREIIITQN